MSPLRPELVTMQLRCELCTNVIEGTSNNDVLWKARGLLWSFQGESLADIYAVYCPLHETEEMVSASGRFWRVGCWSCDWNSLDDDISEQPTTKEEAQQLAKDHSCYEYDYTPEDTWVRSPEDSKGEEERQKRWVAEAEERSAALAAKALEKNRQEENAAAVLVYLRHMEQYGQKWTAFVDYSPYWASLIITIIVFAFVAGMTFG